MKHLLTGFAASAALLVACAESTPYQRATAEGGYGYSEQQVEENRFMVSFSGNSLTERQSVETFLLYRAAELTRERGYDYFRLIRRDTEAERRFTGTATRYHDRFDVFYRYYHPRHGWYGWRDPFWDDVNLREVTRYEAMAEVQLGRGETPDSPDAFDAADVIRNLGPLVRPPVQ
ncbi:MAG: lipoprotein [Oceanicaulis sp. HLUCCA04]|nr:MAG: lipoprotein [Oceanicaulis sp. HLUCCA04]